MVRLICVVLIVFITTSNGLADATIPTSDKKGGKDNPLLKRYEGSFIVAYEYLVFYQIQAAFLSCKSCA
jgi:OmpA-OmpF porin, OOP family